MTLDHINNIERFNQKVDFSGLKFGTIMPSDIDAFIDFGNRYFIAIEFKCVGKDMPFGEELAFQRLVDNLEENGKPTIGIIATHSTETDEVVDASNCDVLRWWGGKKWHRSVKPIKVRKLIEWFLKQHGWSYRIP
jgi:hypothetical protein